MNEFFAIASMVAFIVIFLVEWRRGSYLVGGMQLPSLTAKDKADELRLDAVTSSQLDLLTSYGYEYFLLMYS